MRYWLLTTEYPPFYGGGIATYSFHTAKMLSLNGNEVTVFVPDYKIERGVLLEERDKIRVVRFKPGKSKVYEHLGYVSALSYQFSEVLEEWIRKEEKPDIIESQEYLGIAYFLLQKKYLLWKEFRDIPIILTLHTPKFLCDIWNQAPVYKFPDFWIGEMERFCMKSADAVISPSYFLINVLRNYIKLDEGKTFIIRNPYYFEENKFLSDEEKEDKVAFLGRLEYRKGCVQLLSYMSNLWNKGLEIRLILIGGDTFFHPKSMMMSDYLKKKYNKYFEKGLIEWKGAVEPNKLPLILSKIKLGIIPSLMENFPYVALELLSQGVITLVSDSGGHAEVVEDGLNGFIFLHKNPRSFEEKFLKAVNLSKKEIKNIVEHARKRVKEMCSYDVVYSNKMEAIDKVLRFKKEIHIFPFIRDIPRQDFSKDRLPKDYHEKPDLLSVIIPYYNMGNYIKDTLESIINSTYPDKEIVIVNDGSDDPDSIAVLYEIEKKYPVKIIHKQNEGLAKARNTGALHANGEFIAFLDADDMVNPEYYEYAIKILRHYKNVDFVGCWEEYFEGAQGIWPTWNPEPPYLLVHNTINSQGIVVRKKIFLLFGLNDPEMEYGLEDYEAVVRMVSKGCRGVIIPNPFFRYRVRKSSMLREISRNGMIYLYNLLVNKNSEIFKQYAVDVINLINANGPGYLYDNPTWELPPIGFVSKSSENSKEDTSNWRASKTPPLELKQKLLELWGNPCFRTIIKLFFKLRLHKLFSPSFKKN